MPIVSKVVDTDWQYFSFILLAALFAHEERRSKNSPLSAMTFFSLHRPLRIYFSRCYPWWLQSPDADDLIVFIPRWWLLSLVVRPIKLCQPPTQACQDPGSMVNLHMPVAENPEDCEKGETGLYLNGTTRGRTHTGQNAYELKELG